MGVWKRKLRRIRQDAKTRPDDELKHALVRVGAGAVFCLWSLWTASTGRAGHTVVLFGIGFAGVSALMLWRTGSREKSSAAGRLAGIGMDAGALGFGVFWAGEYGVLLAPLYLCLCVGAGIRYGARYLYLCVGLSAVLYALGAGAGGNWIADRTAVGADLLGMVFVPSYVLRLLRSVDRKSERIRQVDREIEASVTRDMLTGLPNRLVCYDRIEHGIESAKRRGGELLVAVVGLERLERVHATHGATVCDEVVCQAADRMRRAVRASDTVGRLGNDEFLVAGEAAVTCAPRILGALGAALESPFRVESGPIHRNRPRGGLGRFSSGW